MTTLMGGVSRHTYAATFPPDRFYCLLDELPLHLIPQRALRSLRLRNDSDDSLFLNPECTICPPGQLPEELAPEKERLSGFALQGTIAWVRDSVTGSLLPFWLGPGLEAAVRNLKRDEPVSESVRADARKWLAAAGILTREDQRVQRLREWEDAVEKAARRFSQERVRADCRPYSPLSPGRFAALLSPLDSHGCDQAGRWPKPAALCGVQRAGGEILPSSDHGHAQCRRWAATETVLCLSWLLT